MSAEKVIEKRLAQHLQIGRRWIAVMIDSKTVRVLLYQSPGHLPASGVNRAVMYLESMFLVGTIYERNPKEPADSWGGWIASIWFPF